MFNLDILKDIILESRREHSNMRKEILDLLDKGYELVADPFPMDNGATVYILKKPKEIS
jgi:hypothetical protein